MPFEESIKILKTALENGANNFNAADFYGKPDINSLHLLKHYFTRYPEDRDKAIVSIKSCFDFKTLSADSSPEGIDKSLGHCLDVLDGAVSIDIFAPGRVDKNVPIETTMRALAAHVEAGRIGGIGLSECSAATIRRAHAVHPVAAVEVELSLFSTGPLTNGITEACAELGIPIIAYSPLSKGFLSGQLTSFDDLPEHDFRRMFPRFQRENFDANLKLVDHVKQVAERRGCSVAQVAIGWVSALSDRPDMPTIIPIPGSSNVERVKENLTPVKLTAADMTELGKALDKAEVKGARFPGRFADFLDG